MKKSVSAVISVVILLLMLARPELSLSGAKKGLSLWSGVVLPTLLPFMICSGAIVAAGGVPLLVLPFRPVLRRVFGFSEEGSFVFLTGLLCGYPMGAKTDREFLEWGMIGEKEARCLLAVSNHPSPMFLLGYVMAAWDQQGLLLLLLSVYLPLLPLSFAARKFYGVSSENAVWKKRTAPALTGFSFEKSMMNSIEVMVKIGGYIMLFSIAAEFIKALSPLPEKANALILGATEITTGIHQISLVTEGSSMRLFITAAAVFGGVSGIFQTKGVLGASENGKNAKKAGLSIRHYVIWKLIHAAPSCITLGALSLLLPQQLAPLP